MCQPLFSPWIKKADQSIAQVLIGRYLAFKGIGSRVIADPLSIAKNGGCTADHFAGFKDSGRRLPTTNQSAVGTCRPTLYRKSRARPMHIGHLSAANGKLLYMKRTSICTKDLRRFALRYDNYLELVPEYIAVFKFCGFILCRLNPRTMGSRNLRFHPCSRHRMPEVHSDGIVMMVIILFKWRK